MGSPSLAARAPRARRPQTARQRRGQLLNRVIVFVLVADVLALVTIEINHADRPEVTTASGGEASGALVQEDLGRLKDQLPAAEFPRTGQRSQTVGGSQLTLHSFQLPATGTTAGATPKSGHVFAAADVEGCTGAEVRGGAAKIDAQRFRFELGDGTKIPAGTAVKTPALTPATVPAGKCTRGWISFEVPQGKRNGFLVYAGTSEIRWTVP